MSNNVDIQKCQTTRKYIDKYYNLQKFDKKQKCGDNNTKCIEVDLFDQDDEKDYVCVKNDFEFKKESLAQKIKEKMINCDKFLYNNFTTGLMLDDKKNRRGEKYIKNQFYRLDPTHRKKIRSKLSRFDKNGKKISYDNYDQFECLEYADVLKRKCKNSCQEEGTDFECNRFKEDKKEEIDDYEDIDLLDKYSYPQLYRKENPYKAYWKINPNNDNNIYKCRKSKKALKKKCKKTCKGENVCSRLKIEDSFEIKRSYPEHIDDLYKCIVSKKTLKENCKKDCSKKNVCSRFYNNSGYVAKYAYGDGSSKKNNPYKCYSNDEYEKLKQKYENIIGTGHLSGLTKFARNIYTPGRGTAEN